MKPFIPPELIPAFPEITLAILALLLLMLGVARQEEDYRTISHFSLFTLIAVIVVICRFGEADGLTTFGGMFVVDGFAAFMKILVVSGTAVSVMLAMRYVERERIMRFEYPVLMLFATLGMMVMISANDLISLYMGLELQSLPLYVLAAIQRDTVRSTEAGLKYFVLGALSSGMLLYGASLLYGYTGTTNFDLMAETLAAQQPTLGVIVGMVLLISGIAFKISAVPFHMWTPDVYEGAPTSVTAFFAIAPKIAALALLTRVLTGPFGDMEEQWRQIIIVLSLGSMFVGAVAAIVQTNIKRLLAYSSIGHMGYALIGLAAGGRDGVEAVMIYLAIYMVMSIGAFAVVLMMKQKDRMVEEIADLAGLARKQPMVALAMAVMMFSMAGIPPLAGFFGKLFIFQAAIEAKLYALSVLGVLASVVAAYYYIRIIKVMYFEEAPEDGLDPAEDRGLNVILAASTLAVTLFIVIPGPLLIAVEAAASSLWM